MGHWDGVDQRDLASSLARVASGIMASAFGVGALLSGLVNMLLGVHGWRFVFLVGIVPAILVAMILQRIPESRRWEEVDARRREARARLSKGQAITASEQQLVSFTLAGLFQKQWLRNTVVGTLMSFAATAGFWGSQTWLPVRAAQLAVAAKANPIQVASWTVIIANIGAAIGMFAFAAVDRCHGATSEPLCWPALAAWWCCP